MEKSIPTQVLELVDSIMMNCNDDLIMLMMSSSHEGKIYLSMPSKFIHFLKLGLQEKFHSGQIEDGDIGRYLRYKGVQTVPNHEMSVVLYHEDYWMRQDQNWIEKVLLMDPYHSNRGIYNEVLVNLTEYVKLP